MRRIVWVTVGLVVLAALAGGGWWWWQTTQGEEPPPGGGGEVAVRVDGDPVYATTVDAQYQRLLQTYGAVYAREGQAFEAALEGAEGGYYRLQIRYQAAQQLIDQVVIRQAVERRGIRVSDGELDEAFRERFGSFLHQHGLTEEGLSELFENAEQKRLAQELLGLQDGSVAAFKARLRQEVEVELLRAALAEAVVGEPDALASDEGQGAFRRWLDGAKADAELTFEDPYLRAYHLEQRYAEAEELEQKQALLTEAIQAYEGIEAESEGQSEQLEFILAQLFNLQVNLDLQRERALRERGDQEGLDELQNRIDRNRERAGETFLSIGIDDEQQFRLMLMADADNPLYNYLYARFLLSSPEARASTALRFLTKAIELDPEYIDAHVLMGDYNVDREHYAAAVEGYERALELFEAGADEEAASGEEGAPRSRESRPGRVRQKLAEALLGLARQRQDAGEGEQLALVERARSLLSSLEADMTENDPALPDVLARLGEAAGLAGDYEAAQARLQASLALREAPDVRVQLGRSQLAAGQLAEAEASFGAVLEAHPAWAEAHAGLGEVLRARGETERAFEAFQTAFEYSEPLDYTERRALGREALAINPDDLAMRLRLADFYFEHNVYAAAEELYASVRERAPESWRGHEGLGKVARARLQYEDAQAHFGRALEHAPDAAARTQVYERVLETEERRAGPGNPVAALGQDALLALAELYLDQERWADSQDALRQLRQDHPGYEAEAVRALTERARTASGDDLPGTAVRDLGSQLISPGESHPPYNSVPPTSGWHYAVPVDWGIHGGRIPDEVQLRNLASGGVLIQYHPNLLDGEGLQQLQDLVASLREEARYCRLLLAPHEALERPIALTAWNRLDRMDQVQEGRIRHFIDTFIGQGPEVGEVGCQ